MQLNEFLSGTDKKIISKAKMGKRVGFGKKIAIMIIDAQVYMLGDRSKPILESIKRFPSSCGEKGWAALQKIKDLIRVARQKDINIFYTKMQLSADGKDAGIYTLKRDLLRTPNWMIEGTPGVKIIPEISPCPKDIVIIKKKPSAFFGTPLISYLHYLNIDTIIITGGSTSNCVRATVYDAASYNFHVIVAKDAVFDRIDISHEVSLLDMDRQYADVIMVDEIIDFLKNNYK